MSETKGKHTPRCPKCGNSSGLHYEVYFHKNYTQGVKVWCENCPETAPDIFCRSLTDFAQFFPHEQLVAALRAMLKAYKQLMPGIVYIAVQDYANINEAPIMARAALRAAGEDVE